MFKIKTVAVMVCLLMLFPVAFNTAFAGEPTDQLKTDVDRIIKMLNERKLSRDQRNQQIVELIRQRFNFPLMSQWILGINWRKATPAQRERFITLFTQQLENTYMRRIEAYTGTYSENNVKYVDEDLKKGRALVKTLIVTKTNEIPVNYKLVKSKGEWRVYDVVIEEVSLVSTYRKTYGKIVDREGFDGLFARMEKKIEELQNTPAPKKTQT